METAERTIQKKATRKRVYACDRCRASKKKCDGKAPCSRCWKTEKECTYTAPTAGQVFPAGGVVQAPVQTAVAPAPQVVTHMNNAAISRRHFDMFNMTVKPLVLMDAHYDYEQFLDNPSTARQLQYYAIMASMNANLAGDSAQCSDYLHRARHLGADLLDDFQLETAKGFHLLAFHHWGKDSDRMGHYRDITLSICRRILSRSSPEREEAIRLCLVTLCLTNMDEPTLPCDVESLVRTCQDGPYCRFLDLHATRQAKPATTPLSTRNTALSTAQMYLWVHFQAEMGRLIFAWAQRAPAPGQALFRPLNEETTHALLSLLADVSNIMVCHTVESPYLEMGLCMGQAMYSVIYYAGGYRAQAFAAMESVVRELTSVPNFAALAGPFFISLSHWMFLMAYVERNYPLAHRFLDIQTAISRVSPPILPSLHANTERMRAISSSSSSSSLAHSHAHARAHSHSHALPEYARTPTSYASYGVQTHHSSPPDHSTLPRGHGNNHESGPGGHHPRPPVSYSGQGGGVSSSVGPIRFESDTLQHPSSSSSWHSASPGVVHPSPQSSPGSGQGGPSHSSHARTLWDTHDQGALSPDSSSPEALLDYAHYVGEYGHWDGSFL